MSEQRYFIGNGINGKVYGIQGQETAVKVVKGKKFSQNNQDVIDILVSDSENLLKHNILPINKFEFGLRRNWYGAKVSEAHIYMPLTDANLQKFMVPSQVGDKLGTILDPRIISLVINNTSVALDYMHNNLGLAHNDVQPKNVAVYEGRPVLMDFDQAQIAMKPEDFQLDRKCLADMTRNLLDTYRMHDDNNFYNDDQWKALKTAEKEFTDPNSNLRPTDFAAQVHTIFTGLGHEVQYAA